SPILIVIGLHRFVFTRPRTAHPLARHPYPFLNSLRITSFSPYQTGDYLMKMGGGDQMNLSTGDIITSF
ncbi:MAG: hypothetical protein VYC64_18100, partial [Candidatus Latescibacterota bacterium]|nr:hypothetical protein [Candidatus Latescibacterota bacterium]